LGLYVSKDYQTQQYVYSNTIPTLHKGYGKREGDHIVPRDEDGNAGPLVTSPPYIGVLAIGFSNMNNEFGDFLTDKIEPLTGNLDGLNDRLVFVNGGIPAKAMCEWIEP